MLEWRKKLVNIYSKLSPIRINFRFIYVATFFYQLQLFVGAIDIASASYDGKENYVMVPLHNFSLTNNDDPCGYKDGW